MTESYKEKSDICLLSKAELEQELVRLGERPYRAGQIYGWLHQKKAVSFDDMSNISKSLKESLGSRFYITPVNIEQKYVSRLDGTAKYVLSLYDGNVIEAVLMRYKHGNSVCVSSQVGCRMGCSFCASAIGGCVRNLSRSEMLHEVYAIERDTGERVSNVVIMGSGEPLDNYDETIGFIRGLNDKDGLGISARNITLSTCGIVPCIYKLADERLPITLAISLHAAVQEKREKIMPIARRYPLDELMKACRHYYDKTGRRISFEYSVISGINDSAEDVDDIVRLLSAMGKRARGGSDGAYHLNLIPVNPIKERDYKSPGRERIADFKRMLSDSGVNVTVRREMGRDINSACGQLRRRYIENAGSGSDRHRSEKKG